VRQVMDQLEGSIQALKKCFFLIKKNAEQKVFEAVLIDRYPDQKSNLSGC
jgi:hypothetical protein